MDQARGAGRHGHSPFDHFTAANPSPRQRTLYDIRSRGCDHLHLYVLEGEYLVQVGDTRFPLKMGDCILGPRGVPHAWAFVALKTGRLLLSYAPTGKMEAFFNA